MKECIFNIYNILYYTLYNNSFLNPTEPRPGRLKLSETRSFFSPSRRYPKWKLFSLRISSTGIFFLFFSQSKISETFFTSDNFDWQIFGKREKWVIVKTSPVWMNHTHNNYYTQQDIQGRVLRTTLFFEIIKFCCS